MNKIDQAFNILFPPNQTLWDRGGATMHEREIEPGHREMVPFFDLEIDRLDQIGEKTFTSDREKKIGRTLVYNAITSDGIDREVHLHLPDSLGSDFTVTDGAAWTTRNNGYARGRAETIVDRADIPVIQVGAEHSTRNGISPGNILHLGKTAKNAFSISLAKTAQSEELIISALMEQHDLPRKQYIIGDSRAAMKAPGQYPYAKEYGNDVAFMDIVAPCVPDKLTIGDLPRFAAWGAVEAIGGAAIGGTLIASGKFDELRRTATINPNFALSSLIGVAPALAAGIESTRLVPKDAHGHVVVYDRDLMSETKKWDERFSGHENIFVKHVEHGIHLSLVSSFARAKQVRRVSRFAELYNLHHGNVADIDQEENNYINNDHFPDVRIA